MQAPIHRVGFACVLCDGSLSTNHNFRLAGLTPDRLRQAVDLNLNDLETILQSMSTGPLRLFRIGSSFVPFASHRSLDFDWKPLVADRLAAIGARYSALGFRLSMHPGQYTVLNSPNPDIVAGAIAEVEYSCTVLDLMGLDGSHKVVVHGGGIYGQREASTERLIAQLRALPDRLRRRLVLENDERYFNLAQITEVSEASGIPAVFDLHHHQINPVPDAESWLLRLRAVWDCRPKVHLSSQKPNARIGAHDDMLFPEDLARLCDILPFEADLMVEAKSKERAALEAWTWLQSHDRLASPVTTK